SSRRRHTRSKRDWSSDVCSSDLLSRRSGRWWALTAVFIALTIACHPVTGAFVAGYIAVVQLSEMRLGGIRPLVALGALSFLLAEIGRASCRERVLFSVVVVAVNN